jgi:hypothetical protein
MQFPRSMLKLKLNSAHQWKFGYSLHFAKMIHVSEDVGNDAITYQESIN